MGSTIKAGTTIQDNAFVGARSLVEKNSVILSGTIYAGRPAKFFRNTKEEEVKYFKKGQKIYEKLALIYNKELYSLY